MKALSSFILKLNFIFRYRKYLILFFVYINIHSICRANWPPFLSTFSSKVRIESENYFPLKLWLIFDDFVGTYSQVLGLNQRYSMFSTIHRNIDYNLFYGIENQTGRRILLPIELTEKRTWWQRHVVDHLGAKFHLNFYSNPGFRQSYSEFLCDEWNELASGGFDSVEVVRHFRAMPILEQSRSYKKMPLDGRDPVFGRETYKCRGI